jgi:hypothetical protein
MHTTGVGQTRTTLKKSYTQYEVDPYKLFAGRVSQLVRQLDTEIKDIPVIRKRKMTQKEKQAFLINVEKQFLNKE